MKTATFAAVMDGLVWPWRAASVVRVLPRAVSEPLYVLIAANRYRAERRACPLASAELCHRLLD